MGTTTFFLRHNDLRRRLSDMTKEELQHMDELSPYKENNSVWEWRAAMELHNGNVHPLIFWKGSLMRLDEAPNRLNKKYYNKYTGKTLKEYEWTVLRRFLLSELHHLDKEFKKMVRKVNEDKKND